MDSYILSIVWSWSQSFPLGSGNNDSLLGSSPLLSSLVLPLFQCPPSSRRKRPLEQPPAPLGPGLRHAIVFFGPPFRHARFHPVGPVRIDNELAQDLTRLG